MVCSISGFDGVVSLIRVGSPSGGISPSTLWLGPDLGVFHLVAKSVGLRHPGDTQELCQS